MAAKTKESQNTSSPASRVAAWARQGIDTFMTAQKIMLDLASQQNALLIGMVRERLGNPRFKPGEAIATIADKGVKNLATAGKILLDLAAGETTVVVEGVKNVVPLPLAAGTVANVVRHRVVTLLDMQRRLLEAAAKQTHLAAECYSDGKGVIAAGVTLAELAQQGVTDLIETEKKFLDLAAHEVTAATKDSGNGHKPAPQRIKVLAQMLRETSEIALEAQRKLLNLAAEQMESVGETAGRRAKAVRAEARTSWNHLAEKSVKNLVTAEKSLMDIVVKPAVNSPRIGWHAASGPCPFPGAGWAAISLNCAVSVDPSSAVVDAVPLAITCCTASKYPVPTNC
jgi:hypothetical protein